MIQSYLSYSYTVKSSTDKETVLSWSAPEGDKTKPYRGITIWVDAKTTTIEKVCAVDKNGNESTYTFKKTKTGGQIPPETFDFEAPKGVEVLDTRK
jgi:outer membrane lipoprotein-sorting protein